MYRFLLPVALFALVASPLWADDPAKDEKAVPASAAEKLKADPNSTTTINAYMSEALGAIRKSIDEEKYDEAEKKLAEMKALLDSLTPDQPAAKTLLTRAKNTVPAYREFIELAKTPLADLESKVDADPNDAATFSKYTQKVSQEVGGLARSDPEKAEAALDAAKARIAKVQETSTNDSVKRQADTTTRSLASLERTIASSKKLLSLVGKDAESLAAGQIDAWVNGTPLTDADLKGKVVFLDFWAVWCGPCIATFPHLKEWNEKYADKGLVMIGLTRYYNYKWDDAAGKANRSQEKVAAADEQKMLENFAESHGLTHRFAVQGEGSSLDEYYAVSGIPHVVLIDQEGKIRMIKVGSGDENAKAIGEMLEKLLADK